MATVTLGWAFHLLVACFTGFVAEALVNFDLCRLAFVALGTVVSQSCLVSFVVESYGAFFVVIGVAVSSDSNVGTDEGQQHHDDYQFFHFHSPVVKVFVWA